MDKDRIRRSRQARQAHPRRDPTELQRIGEHAGLPHIGAIVADLVTPLFARHELERALQNPAGVRLELRTAAAELAA